MKRVEEGSVRWRGRPRIGLAAALALALLLDAVFVLPRSAGAETLRIGGTGGAMGGLRQVAEKFRASRRDRGRHDEVTVTP